MSRGPSVCQKGNASTLALLVQVDGFLLNRALRPMQ